MTNALHSDNSNYIRDFVDDPIVADANPPAVLCSSEFAATRWPRIRGETSESSRHASANLRRETFQVFLRRTLDDDLIHSSALREIGENVFQRSVVQLPALQLFQPRDVFRILQPLDHLLILLDR